jgi:ADP-ribose pyrophosphatase
VVYLRVALSRWKKLRQEFEIKNPWWTYKKDITLLPGGKEGEYHFVHVKGSSMVIPVLDDGRILMVNQYRYLADRESLEFPCGSVKDSSTFEATAAQELAEEAGLKAGLMRRVGEFNPYNGVTDEMCRVYVARSFTETHVGRDETEEFEKISLTPAELDDRIRSGEIWDGMTLASWAIARDKLNA